MKNIIIVLAFLTIGCRSNTYTIPKDDYKLIPYKGNEELVFKSNKGDVDTVFLQGTKRFFSPINQWSYPIKNCEHFSIVSKRSDPTIMNVKGRYLDSLNLITLFNDGDTKIEIEFTAKTAWFYGDKIYTKQEFLELKNTILDIGVHRYNDIVILHPNWTIGDNKQGNIVERPNSIIKLYWSGEKGIVRYDKPNNEYWELMKIIASD